MVQITVRPFTSDLQLQFQGVWSHFETLFLAALWTVNQTEEASVVILRS